MEESIQVVPRIERVTFFGIRHLSPSGSYHLLRLLEKQKPKCVLIEGPSDANYLIPSITRQGVKPPIAILSYTADLPVQSVLYPFAEYSTEYQALLWASENNAKSSFIDIPTGISMALMSTQNEGKEDVPSEDNKNKEADINENELTVQDYYDYVDKAYSQVAVLSGEHSFEDYWERNFEHNLKENVYMEAVKEHSKGMRECLEPQEIQFLPKKTAINCLRESYMSAQIAQALEEYEPEEIVVISGAYHTSELKRATPITQEQLQALPIRNSKLTIMPYSFYRLSTRSGYGAGNNAPEYYNLMWECMNKNMISEFPTHYVSRVGRFVRENGGYCSTANVIEAVRLSHALACLNGGSLPTLSDMQEAIRATIGNGEYSVVADAIARANIGTAIGDLPEGISQTPIQDDLARQLKSLKLEKYKTVTEQQLDLDLRENIKVSSEAAAFMDLNRSTFLHRLDFLGIGFAKKLKNNSETAWREIWLLRWSPEVEIRIVESVLLGETIELAAAFKLKEAMDVCKSVYDAAKMIGVACRCRLTSGVENSLSMLQAIAAESISFTDNAFAASELSAILQYSDLRMTDPKPLKPLLAELFLHACLLLSEASGCDDEAAKAVANAMNVMHRISQESSEIIADNEWVKVLRELKRRDDKNSRLSGLAFAILLERNLINDEECSNEIKRRLSPCIPASIGAGWFEGIAERNHYALISRIELWRELDNYITGLDKDEFMHAIVFLRRAFSGFTSREKNSVAELLADFWNFSSAEASLFLQDNLSEGEMEAIDSLNDFDFDF